VGEGGGLGGEGGDCFVWSFVYGVGGGVVLVVGVWGGGGWGGVQYGDLKRDRVSGQQDKKKLLLMGGAKKPKKKREEL